MSNIILSKHISREDQLTFMNEDAKFEIGNSSDAENTLLICTNEIKAKKISQKIPKMFLSNKCAFNCAYCGCRSSLDKPIEYCNTPRELANMAIEEAKNNGHGVFITSAIYKNADYTQELLAECVRIMREDLYYNGFIHAKIMPGSDPLFIKKTGKYANRLSINIEVVKNYGYDRIAKQKNKYNILTPMRDIAEQILEANYEKRHFASSQTTQLMAGSIGEDDRTIITLSQALYRKYHLKRVYYTPFQYKYDAIGYEKENLQKVQTPYWRMARLYQADRLLQLYGFSPDDITPTNTPNLQQHLDPKAAWVLRNLDLYPIEVNHADFDTLLRIPGIGITYANKIIEARKHCIITHDILKQMKVSLKKCIYFITCNGKYKGSTALSTPRIESILSSEPKQMSILDSLSTPKQKSHIKS